MTLLAAGVALAQPVQMVGDIVVIQDPNGAITNLVSSMGAFIPSPQEQFCRAAFNVARTHGLPDEFDGIISFSTYEGWNDIQNVWQGPPVRADGTGYGRQTVPWANTYNSSRLGQCVFMGTLGQTAGLIPQLRTTPLPNNPDDEWAPSIGIPIPGVKSLTGIEMLGHEYGHHWLLGIEFDQNDGRGRQHFIRGFGGDNGENGQEGSPNQHYSHYADSRSVMYGECITDLGNGSFRIAGCERKYSQLDQYLMGLRGPNEVAPMMVLEDPANPGKGVDTVAMSRSGSKTVSGLVRHDVTVDEIVRAMGARIPAVPNARTCWRVAFVVVLAPGQTTIPQAMLDKVNRYRARWGPWFNFATDGRGTMDTRLTGNGCVTFGGDGGVIVPPVDAGQPMLDAGQPEDDAGVVEPDAGTPPEELDAGQGGEDAGSESPMPLVDAGIDAMPPDDIGKLRPGCGCSALPAAELAALATAVALARRRRR
jgi:hypothetical protein